MQAAGKRLVELLKGQPGMCVDIQHDCRAMLLNAVEHPVARKLLTIHLPPEQQEIFLGPLPVLPWRCRVITDGRQPAVDAT
jgi:hypothetical protein